MIEREAFGPDLRRERERRGITLQQIATQTKISATVFAALERNDLTRWPSGIFRRSFVRSCAQAVVSTRTASCATSSACYGSAFHVAPQTAPGCTPPAGLISG